MATRIKFKEVPMPIDRAVELMNLREPNTRAMAVNQLGKTGKLEALKYLSRAAYDNEMRVRVFALDAIREIWKANLNSSKASSNIRRHGLPQIIHLLKDQDQVVRMHALEALGEIAGEKSINHFIERLDDKAPMVSELAGTLITHFMADQMNDKPYLNHKHDLFPFNEIDPVENPHAFKRFYNNWQTARNSNLPRQYWTKLALKLIMIENRRTLTRKVDIENWPVQPKKRF